MAYFSNAKEGEEVYGLIFGKGKILQVFSESYYSIMVKFNNGYEVPYTDEGIPSCGSFDTQTLFYRQDIDLFNEDFSPVEEVLGHKHIIKLRQENALEVRLPSGVWKGVEKADEEYIERIVQKELYHLFRQKNKEFVCDFYFY